MKKYPRGRINKKRMKERKKRDLHIASFVSTMEYQLCALYFTVRCWRCLHFVFRLTFESICLSQQNANNILSIGSSYATASELSLGTDRSLLHSVRVIKNNKGTVNRHSTCCLRMREAPSRCSYKWSLTHGAWALYKPSVQWGASDQGIGLKVKPKEDGFKAQRFRSAIRDQCRVFPTRSWLPINFFSEQVFPGTSFLKGTSQRACISTSGPDRGVGV